VSRACLPPAMTIADPRASLVARARGGRIRQSRFEWRVPSGSRRFGCPTAGRIFNASEKMHLNRRSSWTSAAVTQHKPTLESNARNSTLQDALRRSYQPLAPSMCSPRYAPSQRDRSTCPAPPRWRSYCLESSASHKFPDSSHQRQISVATASLRMLACTPQ